MAWAELGEQASILVASCIITGVEDKWKVAAAGSGGVEKGVPTEKGYVAVWE